MRRRLGLLLVFLTLAASPAGAAEKTPTEAFNGTFAVGEYTFPASYGAGIDVPADQTAFGVVASTGLFTNTATRVLVVVELSYDGGNTWPPQNKSLPIPAETDYCQSDEWQRTGGPAYTVPPTIECRPGRPTTATTKLRARMEVAGASATGIVEVTWR